MARPRATIALVALIAATGYSAHVAGQTQRYVVETVVAGSPMKGVHGLAFDPAGTLHAVSITGMSIYRIDVDSGAVETVIGPPDGVGDDLAFGPDGSLAWTARDRVLLRTPSGAIRTVAEGLDGLNAISFGPDGRLFFTLIFRADALYEGDPKGLRPPRLIAEKLGGLNGFEVTSDGRIVGPLFFGDAIVAVDVETGAVERLADGIATPAAVNLLSNGDIIALGYRTGLVFRIDSQSGDKRILASLEPPIDNLAIDKHDQVYISHSSYNGITQLDPATGATRRILWGDLSAPGGLAVVENRGAAILLAADAWSHRSIDTASGQVTLLPAGPGVFGSTAIAADDSRIVLANPSPRGMVQVLDRVTGHAITTVFGFAAPYGVLTTPDGILVADYAADALIAVRSGEQPTRTTVASGLGGPVGLADGLNGTVFVSGYSDGSVSQINLADGHRTVIVSGLQGPEGLARLPDGTLAVAEVTRRRIIIVDPTTGQIATAAEDLPIGYDLGGTGPAPGLLTGVAATADGSIYVTGDADNSLVRLRPR